MIAPPTISPASTVLVLNDMINFTLRLNPERTRMIDESGVIPNTARCIASLRRVSIPIFWVRVDRRADRADAVETLTDSLIAAGMEAPPPVVGGTPEAAIVDELTVEPDVLVIIQPRYDPFYGTPLDYLLRARRIDTILLGGISTNVGVESCARSARDRGYNVVVLRDCCVGTEADLHEWSLARIMPRFARVMTSEQALSLLA